MVVTVKDKGGLVGRGSFRIGAHAIGKIEQTIEVRQLFLFQQPVYIGEHWSEVGAAEAPELQPGDQFLQLVQTGQPFHALHLGIALDEIDLYPLGEGTTLPQNIAGALQKALNDIALHTAGGVDGNHKFPDALVVPVFQRLDQRNVAVGAQTVSVIDEVKFVLGKLQHLVLCPEPAKKVGIVAFFKGHRLQPVHQCAGTLAVTAAEGLQIGLGLVRQLLPLPAQGFLLPLLHLLQRFVPGVGFAQLGLVGRILLPGRQQLPTGSRARAGPGCSIPEYMTVPGKKPGQFRQHIGGILPFQQEIIDGFCRQVRAGILQAAAPAVLCSIIRQGAGGDLQFPDDFLGGNVAGKAPQAVIHFLPLKGMPQKKVQGDVQQGTGGHGLLCPECAEKRFGTIV